MTRARHRGDGRRGEQGFTLMEVMIGMLLLAATTVIMTQGYMTALSRAGETSEHSLAVAWLQAELDYLRSQGDSVSGTQTITPAACTAPQPCLPPGFSQATIAVTSLSSPPGLKRVDVTLARHGTTPFLAISTYVTTVVYP